MSQLPDQPLQPLESSSPQLQDEGGSSAQQKRPTTDQSWYGNLQHNA